MTTYAIISVGGKQYRVREGERLLVDRLPHEESAVFHPEILLAGGNGDPELSPKGIQVTARVVRHVLGKKIRIGKYKPKKGYRRHTGFRSRLSQIEIETIGKASPAAKPRKKAAEPPAEEKATAKAPDRTTTSARSKPAPKAPVRGSGPGEGARGNRDVPPGKGRSAPRKKTE